METQNISPALIHIQFLSDQLDDLYQETKTERRAIAEWEEDKEFSILGVIELFASDIQGYAEQVKADTFSTNLDVSTEHLRSLNIFNVDYFANWFFDSFEDYPQIKLYVEQIDHLRLLLIEYFSILKDFAAV